jgi:septum formation inhibitor MinC
VLFEKSFLCPTGVYLSDLGRETSMFWQARILLTISACGLATPVTAQAPAQIATTFDGKYFGTATIAIESHVDSSCVLTTSVEMTIVGGQVTVHEIQFTGATLVLHGNVSAAGEVSASSSRATVSGTIHDKVFTGQRLAGLRGDASLLLQARNGEGTRADDAVRRRLYWRVEGI